MSEEGMMKKYRIKIVKRNFQQSADDYHATVSRISDQTQLVWMSSWRWLLKWKIRRSALDRAFQHYDKSKAQHSEVEEYYR